MNLILKNENGSALLITVLILTSILAVAFGAANLVVSGIKMSGGQERSTIAYFAAEAGAEKILWEMQNGFDESSCNTITKKYIDFTSSQCENSEYIESMLNGSNYSIIFSSDSPKAYQSTGGFANVKRIVELGF